MAVRGTTRPTFNLTGRVQLLVIEVAGQNIKGRWQETITRQREILANVQPLKDHEIMLLPESERTRDWIKVYSPEGIFTTREGEDSNPAEYVKWQDDTYRVMSVRRYDMGVLDHFRAFCAREPISALNDADTV